MQYIFSKRLFILTLMFTLLLNPISSIASDTTSENSTHIIGSINLSNNLSVTVQDLYLIPYRDRQLVTYTMAFHNNSNKDLSALDYWSKLSSASGASYSVKLIEEHAGIETFSAKSTEYQTFYAEVGNQETLQQLQFTLQQWNSEVIDYVSVGTISVPSMYTFVTDLKNAKQLRVNHAYIDVNVNSTNQLANYNSNYINIEMQLQNSSDQSIDIPNYQYYFQTKDGLIYKLSNTDTTTTDETTTVTSIIQPREVRQMSLTANIPNAVDITNGMVFMTTPQENIELGIPVASFNMQFNQAPTALFYSEEINELAVQDELMVAASLSQIILDDSQLKVNLNITNEHTEQVALPTYTYTLVTTNGQVITLTLDSIVDSIDAESDATIQLNAKIPATVSYDTLSAVNINVSGNEGKATTIANFPIMLKTDDMDKEVLYQNQSGVYNITMKNAQRLPYQEQDIIAIEINVKNDSENALPLFDGLKATFLLNGHRVEDQAVKTINQDQIINLQPGQSTTYIAYGSFPYTYEFNEVNVILQEMEGERAVQTIADYKLNTTQFTIPTVSENRTYKMNKIGDQMNISIKKTTTYEGNGTNIVYSEIELENLEKRINDLTSLAAYYQTNDGIPYPATITDFSEAKVMPNGKVRIAAWSKVPDNYTAEDFDLLIGESLVGEGENAAAAMIHVRLFNLPEENMAVANTFKQLDFTPYTLKMDDIVGNSLENSFLFKFKYDLLLDNKYELNTDGHSLHIEILDGDDKYSTSLALASENLKVGEGHSNETSFPEKFFDSNGVFNLNVYDEFEGHKKLLATKRLSWDKYYRY
ncbi:hypothetical protein [Longirhabdus pacifica]|uniref:hypothetical protein n=1 Tax=Longirhabdus pacifica TaxID=2305227 RepID=UPI001008975A|nr:hypothetical protein [Longirhabdus pacifica]